MQSLTLPSSLVEYLRVFALRYNRTRLSEDSVTTRDEEATLTVEVRSGGAPSIGGGGGKKEG